MNGKVRRWDLIIRNLIVVTGGFNLGTHILRSPTIYNLLSKIKLVTDRGGGVKRIIEIGEENRWS